MTAKAKHYHSHRVKKRELIRHCEKTPGRRSLLFYTKFKGGFRGNLLKRTDEIASCLAMTAKAKHYHSHRVKKRELIRHCGKTPGRRSLLFYTKFKRVFVAIF